MLRSSPKTRAVAFQKNDNSKQDKAPIPKMMYIALTNVNCLGAFNFPIKNTIGAS